MKHEALPLVNQPCCSELGNSCELLVWWRPSFSTVKEEGALGGRGSSVETEVVGYRK